MIIGPVDTSKQILIVAEIGNNHEGNLDVARQLVREASRCGVDAVKFQTFRTEYFVSPTDVKRFARLKSFELSYQAFEELADFARELGLLFISTPLDMHSANFLAKLVDAFKIASGDNTFYPLIRFVLQTAKPVFISMGLSEGDEVRELIEFVRRESIGNVEERLGLLHCVTSYPTPPEEANLRAIQYLARQFSGTVGYSDHTVGIDAALLSVALGARVIEKHFTLDKNYSDFRDHQLSADPAEMRQLVDRVRLASQMLGKPEKTCQPCEQPIAGAVRRSIVAGRDVDEGNPLSLADLIWTRPGGGLAPGNEHLLIGKRLKRNVRFGERLMPSDVE